MIDFTKKHSNCGNEKINPDHIYSVSGLEIINYMFGVGVDYWGHDEKPRTLDEVELLFYGEHIPALHQEVESLNLPKLTEDERYKLGVIISALLNISLESLEQNREASYE